MSNVTSDALVVKLAANGDIIWGKSFGGLGDDRLFHGGTRVASSAITRYFSLKLLHK